MTEDKQHYRCMICGYIYKPERGDFYAGIEKGTSFDALPEDYKCPMCGKSKEYFEVHVSK